MRLAAAYFATLAVLCNCDFVWLGVVSKPYHPSPIANPMLARPIWAAARIFYLVYCAGITMVGVAPALDAGSTEGDRR